MNVVIVRKTLLALFLSLAPAVAQQRLKPYDGTKVVIQTTAVKRDGTIVIVANVPSKDEIEAFAFECAKQHAITCVGPKIRSTWILRTPGDYERSVYEPVVPCNTYTLENAKKHDPIDPQVLIVCLSVHQVNLAPVISK